MRVVGKIEMFEREVLADQLVLKDYSLALRITEIDGRAIATMAEAFEVLAPNFPLMKLGVEDIGGLFEQYKSTDLCILSLAETADFRLDRNTANDIDQLKVDLAYKELHGQEFSFDIDSSTFQVVSTSKNYKQIITKAGAVFRPFVGEERDTIINLIPNEDTQNVLGNILAYVFGEGFKLRGAHQKEIPFQISIAQTNKLNKEIEDYLTDVNSIDIIFIGAGPIGTMAANQLKLQCPNMNILMFEKRKVPTREHGMNVDLKNFAKMNKSKGFGKILDDTGTRPKISDVEKTQRAYAVENNIKIKYLEIKDFDELKEAYPKTKYFVGSGGLKGMIHPQVFNSENQIKENLQYAIEVKYKVTGKTSAMSMLTQTTAVLANTNHVVSEWVGHLKGETTMVSLRIFVDEPTYKAMEKATFANPYKLGDIDKIPADLYHTINIYLLGRECLVKEEIQENSIRISAITLSIYASKEVCKNVDGKTIFKIGEEAFACPFYRSFNDNAYFIPYFTTAMKALFENKEVEDYSHSSKMFKHTKDPLEYYQYEFNKLVNSENFIVNALNTGLKMVHTSVASSQAIPSFSNSKLLLTEDGRDFLRELKKYKEENKEQNEESSCTIF